MHLNNVITALSIFIFTQTPNYSIDITQLKGFWIEKEYLTILKSSLSPNKALKDYSGTIPYIEIGNNGIQWLYNFHDGDGYGFDSIEYPGQNVISYRGRKGISRFIIDTSNVNLLVWENSDIDKRIMLYKVSKSDINDYINSIVIAGQYSDNNNCLYSFSDSGRCVWNNKTFNYSLGLDCKNCELDWFVNTSEKEEDGSFVVYGFKRFVNKLMFYKVNLSDGEMLSFNKTPFLVLKKIK